VSDVVGRGSRPNKLTNPKMFEYVHTYLEDSSCVRYFMKHTHARAWLDKSSYNWLQNNNAPSSILELDLKASSRTGIGHSFVSRIFPARGSRMEAF